MSVISTISKWSKQNYVILLLPICIFNLLYFGFFYEKEYREVSIRTEINCAQSTEVWYVYKEKFSEKRFFSDRKEIGPNKDYSYQFQIASKNEIEYIGLYWKTEQKSFLRIKSYAFTVDGNWLTEKKHRNVLEYVSVGSETTEGEQGVKVQSKKGGSNWIMLNTTESLNKKRHSKVRHFIPVWANIFILIITVVFLLLNPKKEYFAISRVTSINGTKVLKIIFSIWVFIMPFWTMISHVLMALTVVVTTYLEIKAKKQESLLKVFKNNYLFYSFYAWLLISSIVTDSPSTTMKVALDYSYFILLPVAFGHINKEKLLKVFEFFEKGVLIYFFLLSVYVINNYIKIVPEGSFFNFVEACVERFWHTSYLSLLLLLLFIKNLETPLRNGFFQFAFYPMALFFMFMVNARMPFMVGILLLVIKVVLILNTRRRKFTLVVLALLSIAAITFYFSVGKNNVHNITSKGTSTEARISLWKASTNQIEKHYLFGVGHESTQEAIGQALEKNANTRFRNYNAHNQFLETALGNGVLALLLLVAMLVRFLRKGGPYAFCFAISFAFLFMVESYLNRQAGMIIFTFWYCFFFKTDVKRH
ncbi:O-antigen ligase family protein [Kriegella aquimaris]|uniref:O-antigen ligase n=1 Tax=Kriegella aquimaris TaxID=192904 RepID=A0A1G9QHQ9_9FLAO|nr:O-antigen ligase family protein [Kriegella aquimaris]SDM10569.1 O-antigen ligase [Kriegella aquimaris]